MILELRSNIFYYKNHEFNSHLVELEKYRIRSFVAVKICRLFPR